MRRATTADFRIDVTWHYGVYVYFSPYRASVAVFATRRQAEDFVRTAVHQRKFQVED